MIFSRTSQYAVQALLYLAAQPRGKFFLSRQIAAHLGVPSSYLAKIMQVLSAANLVRSRRGRQGGFCLHEESGQTTLREVFLLMEGPGFVDGCVMGVGACDGDAPCPVHRDWAPIKQSILRILNEGSLKHLAKSVRSGKCRLADLPLAHLLG